MKKKIVSMLLITAIAASLTACGGSQSGGDTGKGAGTSSGSTASAGQGYKTDQITVDIWDNNQLEGLQEIADEWSETSGVKVKINVITWDEYWTLLEAGASGGDLPDVFWMHINEAQKYMEADMLLDLSDYIDADDAIDLDNYYPGITAIYENGGKQYAIPKDHDTIAMIYNKTLFDKYGVDHPTEEWTWEDYAEAAAKITEEGRDDGVFGTAMNTNDGQDGWYNFIYDWGGEIITEDNKKSGMDQENTIAGMTWLADNLFPSMPSQSVMSETDPDNLFLSGNVAMMLQGSWMINAFYTAENSADYAWAEIPYNDANGNGKADEGERCSLYNGLGWAASAGTKDPQAAYDLISFFCSEYGQKKQAELGVTMAAYEGCSDAFISAFDGMDISPFLDIEENGTLIQHPASRYTTAWESGFTSGFIDAWNNPEKMEDVCRDMAKMMNDILASE